MKLLDFYTYHFMQMKHKVNMFEYDPISCKPKWKQQHLRSSKEDKINQTLVYFWGRINEKFDKITKAFRFFDIDCVIFAF